MTAVQRLSALLGAALLLAALLSAAAAEAQPPRPIKASLALSLDRTAYEPGAEVRLAAIVDVEAGWHIQSHWPSLEYLIPTELSVALPPEWPDPEIRYPRHDLWQAGFEAEKLAVYDGRVVLLARFRVPETIEASSVPVTAELSFQACDDRVCLPPTAITATTGLAVDTGGEPVQTELFVEAEAALAPADGSDPVAADDPAVSASGGVTEPPATAGPSLPLVLLLGLVGGLILNAMPCVLPVLSLKVFGLVQSAGLGRRAVTISALATAAGILVSFWALALGAIALRAAGGAVGWGIQFQNPVFVAFLAVILVLFSLNLWGLFEIPLPRGLARFATSGPHHGILGHFATGLFATLMATPCSAPFLGTAVGFGLAQPAWATWTVFTAVGVGMASPYLALAAYPGAASWLPRPGVWMEHLKGVMGFLLAGTVVWLLYVLAGQISPDRLALLEGALVALALFAWLRTRPGLSRVLRPVATLGLLGSLVAVLAIASSGAGTALPSAVEGKRIAWQPFAEADAKRMAADEGRLVFVDVTADWCATCKVNERLVLETDEIAQLFERHEVVAMKADWTNRDDDIARYLAGFGRYAIPFYVLYRPSSEPHVFGELLSRRELVRVVEEAATGAAG